jgi:hypothetical protein
MEENLQDKTPKDDGGSVRQLRGKAADGSLKG